MGAGDPGVGADVRRVRLCYAAGGPELGGRREGDRWGLAGGRRGWLTLMLCPQAAHRPERPVGHVQPAYQTDCVRVKHGVCVHHRFTPPTSTPTATRGSLDIAELQGLHRDALLAALKVLEGQGKVRWALLAYICC